MKIQLKKTNIGDIKPWHQDFRNTESLPDIKVIRTRFFLNVITFVLPVIVGIFWVQKELSLSVLRQDIAELEEDKAAMQDSNRELIELSRDFLKESAKVESLDEYSYNLFPLSDYVLAVSKRVPEDMVLSNLEIKKANRVEGNEVFDIWESEISGFVAQGSQQSITTVNDFVDQISSEELFESYLEEAFLDNLSRDQETDTLSFIVSISLADTGENAGGDKK